MSLAIADITAAGGTRPDEALLISFLELALPMSYHTIRTILRTRSHNTFHDYYNELLIHTKAEERVHQQNIAGVYSAATSFSPRGPAKGKGSPGRFPPSGRGLPRSSPRTLPSPSLANPCFNCGRSHPRSLCRDPHPCHLLPLRHESHP